MERKYYNASMLLRIILKSGSNILPYSALFLILVNILYNADNSNRESADGRFQNNIQNRTLGFQRIYVVNLPEMTDRQDALVLASAVTNISLDWIGGDINNKAYPTTRNPTGHHTPGEKLNGVRRAHMSVMQKIVANRITTTFVLQSDADWDVTLKQQLVAFASGARTLQQQENRSYHIASPTSSPYGDEWDLLWFGYCGAKPRQADHHIYIVANDITAGHFHHRPDDFYEFDILVNNTTNFQSYTRLIFKAEQAVCSTGYAVSLNGARKILAALSLGPVKNVAFDSACAQLCMSKDRFECISTYPALISTWRGAGTDSGGAKEDWREARSDGIVYSTMLNLYRLINGKNVVLAQWGDVLVPELNWKNDKAVIDGYMADISFP